MKFIFKPNDAKLFMKDAVGRQIETIVIDIMEEKEITTFTRTVSKVWEQTPKNNIETDHRIKELKNTQNIDNLVVYTRVLYESKS